VKQVLLDLNVVLDVILDRQPYAEAGARLWAALENGPGKGYIPAHGMTTIYYVIEKAKGAAFARLAVGALLTAFGVAPVNEPVLRQAIALGWLDFEDGVCAAAAEAVGCDVIATRDPSAFPTRPCASATPQQCWRGSSQNDIGRRSRAGAP
jgi:predicted nucleic acid-binding protein